MLGGVLLTVRRMVKRPPEAPAFLTISFCDFKVVWPIKADCWIAEAAMDSERIFIYLFFFLLFFSGSFNQSSSSE